MIDSDCLGSIYKEKCLADLDIFVEYWNEDAYLKACKDLSDESHDVFMRVAGEYGGYAAANALLVEIYKFMKVASNPKGFSFNLEHKGD